MRLSYRRAWTVAQIVFAVVVSIWTSSSRAEESPKPVLSVLEHKGDVFLWTLWQAGSGRRVAFLSAKMPPRHAFWTGDGSTVYYMLGDHIFKAPFRIAPALPVYVAVVPHDAGETRGLWVDKHSNRLRIAQVEAIRERDVVRSGRGVHYRMRDRTLVPARDEPAWGLPAVVTVFELNGKGQWKLLTHRATKDEAGDTPGLSVIDSFRHENGYSTERLLQSYTCRSGICRNDVPAEVAARVSRETGRTLTPEDLSTWRTGPGKRALVFATVMGDEVHIAPPMFLVGDGSGKMAPLPTANRSQLGIGANGPFLLIEDEWSGKDPVVIDLNTGAVRFKTMGSEAVWVPI
jgi:hypothetical protein